MVGPYDYGGDFYPIWLTGRELLFHGKNPYTQEMTRRDSNWPFRPAHGPASSGRSADRFSRVLLSTVCRSAGCAVIAAWSLIRFESCWGFCFPCCG